MKQSDRIFKLLFILLLFALLIVINVLSAYGITFVSIELKHKCDISLMCIKNIFYTIVVGLG